MRTEKFLIAGGNPTLLVWDSPADRHANFAKLGLKVGAAEQVGFVNDEHGVTYLTMMGNELCINASMALAYAHGGSGSFFTRGIDHLVSYMNTDRTTIEVQLPFKVDGMTVLFDGIGYTLTDEEIVVTKERIAATAKRYDLPAFGVIVRKGNAITPHVYVAETDSLIDESACGSGSIAANIVFGLDEIIQPSGETMRINRSGDIFNVSAQVTGVSGHRPEATANTGDPPYANQE